MRCPVAAGPGRYGPVAMLPKVRLPCGAPTWRPSPGIAAGRQAGCTDYGGLRRYPAVSVARRAGGQEGAVHNYRFHQIRRCLFGSFGGVLLPLPKSQWFCLKPTTLARPCCQTAGRITLYMQEVAAATTHIPGGQAQDSRNAPLSRLQQKYNSSVKSHQIARQTGAL